MNAKSFDLVHDYLEVARAAGEVAGVRDAAEGILGRHGHEGVRNAVFSVVAVNLVFAYLSLESFVAEGLQSKGVNVDAPPGPPGLQRRLKALCAAAGWPDPEEADPGLWNRFLILLADAGPLTGSPRLRTEELQLHAAALMTRSAPFPYADTARDCLAQMIGASGGQEPPWLHRNTLIEFRGGLVE